MVRCFFLSTIHPSHDPHLLPLPFVHACTTKHRRGARKGHAINKKPRSLNASDVSKGPYLKIGGQGRSQSDKTTLILRSGRTGLPSKDGQRGLGWNFETRTRQGVGRLTAPQGPSIANKNRPAAQFPSTRECPYRFGRLGPSVTRTTVLVHGTVHGVHTRVEAVSTVYASSNLVGKNHFPPTHHLPPEANPVLTV
ncbi:hypothetical protein K438DRAFT_1937690 [Mycena galopus ATCC 62051]|nr:hypothetical protein K438DRAFT_1937690 [Mycena galopus ATCC 62051]